MTPHECFILDDSTQNAAPQLFECDRSGSVGSKNATYPESWIFFWFTIPKPGGNKSHIVGAKATLIQNDRNWLELINETHTRALHVCPSPGEITLKSL